jgi:probable rRNA maturation factor
VVIVYSKVRGVSARALERFAAQAQRAAGVRGAVDVLITSSAQMRRLNHSFRGKNAATDVLSFPFSHRGTEARRNLFSESSVPLRLRGYAAAGDLAISAQIAARNARRLGHTTADEIKILILHGLLHLAGHDHETDTGGMARKEARLRRALGLPAALIERTVSANGRLPRRA